MGLVCWLGESIESFPPGGCQLGRVVWCLLIVDRLVICVADFKLTSALTARDKTRERVVCFETPT